jgi:hypothetical protein
MPEVRGCNPANNLLVKGVKGKRKETYKQKGNVGGINRR